MMGEFRENSRLIREVIEKATKEDIPAIVRHLLDHFCANEPLCIMMKVNRDECVEWFTEVATHSLKDDLAYVIRSSNNPIDADNRIVGICLCSVLNRPVGPNTDVSSERRVQIFLEPPSPERKHKEFPSQSTPARNFFQVHDACCSTYDESVSPVVSSKPSEEASSAQNEAAVTLSNESHDSSSAPSSIYQGSNSNLTKSLVISDKSHDSLRTRNESPRLNDAASQTEDPEALADTSTVMENCSMNANGLPKNLEKIVELVDRIEAQIWEMKMAKSLYRLISIDILSVEKSCSKRGYGRRLVERVVEDCRGNCDGFLTAATAAASQKIFARQQFTRLDVQIYYRLNTSDGLFLENIKLPFERYVTLDFKDSRCCDQNVITTHRDGVNI